MLRTSEKLLAHFDLTLAPYPSCNGIYVVPQSVWDHLASEVRKTWLEVANIRVDVEQLEHDGKSICVQDQPDLTIDARESDL